MIFFISPGSDYCSVSKEMYQYLLNIYGGGPDIALQPNHNVVCGTQFSTQGNNISLARNAVPLSPCNYGQNVQTYYSSRANVVSSHNQTSGSRIPCGMFMLSC